MLEMTGVSYHYQPGKPAVDNVSLCIRAGEFAAIAGRNGSGKTTLTRLVMSLIKPANGQIVLNGVNTSSQSPGDIARHVGYVFQNPDSQIFRDTVASEVAYGPEQLGFSAPEIASSVAEALEKTGLTALADVYPRSLSRGQKQRVTIASALAMKPDILILDEPTSGQDAKEKESLLRILTELNEQGKTIILVTHDMDILARYAKRVVVMASGAKVFDGPVAELFAQGNDIRKWGLRAPAIMNISRKLSKYGVFPVLTATELSQQIAERVQRGRM
ncbi:MAG: ecfA2 3 [Firmicutes bacterium]|nr:ecfA2 3 [Bacillota bacterium]